MNTDARTAAPGACGTLYLVPNSLDPAIGPAEAVMPALALARVRTLRRFIVEGEKAAWRLLAKVIDKEGLASVSMEILDEHSRPEDLPRLL